MGRGLLSGRVAIVTGAASGIGRATALAYADEGATVAVLDRDETGAQRAAHDIECLGGRAIPYVVDIGLYPHYKSVVEDVAHRYGGIDILVNNAAVVRYHTLPDLDLAAWREVLHVDLEAVYVGTGFAVPRMIERGEGRIINLSSIQAFTSSGEFDAYGTAKAGIVGLTKSLAVTLAPHNITVNAIAPGFIRTGMSLVDGADETETEHFRQEYIEKRRIPLARVGEPADVAGTAVFLASDYCRYMTGQVLVVDGGLMSTF